MWDGPMLPLDIATFQLLLCYFKIYLQMLQKDVFILSLIKTNFYFITN